MLCLADFHDTGTPFRKMTYPPVDLLVILQSASELSQLIGDQVRHGVMSSTVLITECI